MNNQLQHKEQEITHRVIAMLDRRQMEFLDKLGKDAMFTARHKLSYNNIIRALIDFAIDINLNAEGIKSEQELKERIKEKKGPASPLDIGGETGSKFLQSKNFGGAR
jgi:hypothetical protein